MCYSQWRCGLLWVTRRINASAWKNIWTSFLFWTYIQYVRGRQLRGRGDNYAAVPYPLDAWNKFQDAEDGLARSNNAVEGWHHALQSLFSCQHPIVCTLLDGIRRNCKQHVASALHFGVGAQFSPKKKHRDLKERVTCTVCNYANIDRLTYLKSLAFISYWWCSLLFMPCCA